MSWANEMAKQFKDRDNQRPLGAIVGEVVSPLPDLTISAVDGQVLLTRKNLYISAGLKEKQYKADVAISDGSTELRAGTTESYEIVSFETEKDTTTITMHFELKPGDMVLLLPTADEQTFYVIDKVEKL